MVLEHSPILNTQLRAVAGLEHSPARNALEQLISNFILAGMVEGRASTTLATYYQRLKSFADFVVDAGMPAEPVNVESSHIRLFLLHLREKNLNSSTINSYYRVLHSFFAWSVAEGVLSNSPMRNVKPPRIPQVKPRPFTNEDLQNLLLLCNGRQFVGIRNRAVILLFLDTGLRLSELAGIQLTDIDFTHETIRVMGKGSKDRIVRMGKTAQKALLRYLLTRTDEYPCLWVTEERKPMVARGIQITIKRLCYRAGITDAKPGPHTFRHTAAINFLRNDGGEFALQIMLGHSTLQMTRRYVSTLGAEDMVRAHQKASPVDNMKL